MVVIVIIRHLSGKKVLTSQVMEGFKTAEVLRKYAQRTNLKIVRDELEPSREEEA